MLSKSTLKSKLLEVGLQSTESEACLAWAEAYRTYFSSAAAGPVPVVAAALATPKSEMAAAMTGLSVTGAAAIQAGVAAFWTSLAGVAATAFPASTTATPPAGVTALAAALTAVFLANTSGSLSAEDSYDAIAAAIHTASTGGIAVFPTPSAGIGPQTIQ